MAAERLANFAARFSIERGELTSQSDIVERPTSSFARANDPCAPFGLFMIGNGKRVRAQQNRVHERGIPAPAAVLEREPKSIKRAPDVQAFAFADEAAGAEFHLMASDAQAHVMRGIANIVDGMVQHSE